MRERESDMKKWLCFITALLFSTLLLSACSNDGENSQKTTSEKINVITTFTLLDDIVSQIGGDQVEVYNLVPIGTDPHEYEPLPNDIKAVTDADIVFYNGLNLEGGKNGWLAKLIHSVGKDWDDAINLSEGVDPMYLSSGNGKEEEINPHAFLDPVVGIQMTENTRDALIKIDPENKVTYEKNAEDYLTILKEIDQEYKEKIDSIPEENRILVTSERAYQYMTDRYGLKEGYIWEVDTEENGSPSQIKSLVQFVKENNVPVLFMETNVDPRPMETVSQETGVEIYGKIFSDEIGKPGEEGDTYIKFLQYNIDMIHKGLTSK